MGTQATRYRVWSSLTAKVPSGRRRWRHWRPFDHLTLRYDVAGVTDWMWTYRLDRTDTGTRLTVLISDPGEAAWAEIGGRFTQHVDGLMVVLGRAAESSDSPLALSVFTPAG